MKPTQVKSLYVLMFALLSMAILVTAVGAAQAQAPSTSELVKFNVGGHALAFSQTGMIVAGANHALSVSFLGANVSRPVTAGGATFNSVTYPNLWTGIDLSYIASEGGLLESVYTLAAGANPNAIRLGYNAPIRINADGSLSSRFALGEMRESAPVAWQTINGQRKSVDIAFKQTGENELAFEVGAYNPAYALTIDPELSWHTFLGSSAGGDYVNDLVVDTNDDIYVTGTSNASWGSPISGYEYTGDGDIYVAKLNSAGALQWLIFLGGAEAEASNAITFSNTGDLVITGYSTSSSWTNRGNPLNNHAGALDIFVAKITKSGVLSWYTFAGSAQKDEGNDVAVDSNGNIYYIGISDQYVKTGLDDTNDQFDIHVGKLGSSGSTLWTNLLGDSTLNTNDNGSTITVDTSNNVYIAGNSYTTWGTPTSSDYAHSGAIPDGFVAKINTANGTAIWNNFLGGDGGTLIKDIQANGTDLYVAGQSFSTWSTADGYMGSGDAFIAKMANTGTLTWHSFVGSSTTSEIAIASVIANDGSVYLVGGTNGDWGEYSAPPYRSFGGGTQDGFVAQISSTGNYMGHTFIGGNGAGSDQVNTIALDSLDYPIVGGVSDAAWDAVDEPSAPLSPFTSGEDGFVARFTQDQTDPTIESIELLTEDTDPAINPHYISSSSITSVDFEVTFSEVVKNVTADDFDFETIDSVLQNNGGTATITNVTNKMLGSNKLYHRYVVTVALGSGQQNVSIQLKVSNDIKDTTDPGRSLSSITPPTNPHYSIDRIGTNLAMVGLPASPEIKREITTATFNWTLDADPTINTTCTLTINGIDQPAETCNSKTISYGTLVPLNYGQYTFTIMSSDAAGHISGPLTHTWYVTKAIAFADIKTHDGWLVESGELTNKAGSMNYSGTTLYVGDNSYDKQYRAVLSFDTKTLPAGATPVRAQIQLRYVSVSGTNPFATLGTLLIDIKPSYFGSAATLQLLDFNAYGVLGVGTVINQKIGVYYYGYITDPTILASNINRYGTTQFRLRFTKDDDDKRNNSYMAFGSANHGTLSYRPVLYIDYIP